MSQLGLAAAFRHLVAVTTSSDLLTAIHVRRDGGASVGPDRIRLLKAIGEHGSISAGGKAVGLNFRAAWNAVQDLNNLFAEPLVVSRAGGAGGGSATITCLGEIVIAGFEKISLEFAALMQAFDEQVAHASGAARHMIWSLGMKTSARNALRGVVESVTRGAVNAEVVLRVTEAVAITATVTGDSVDDLGLEPGREAAALIKSSFVILAPGETRLRTSARNCLLGTVVRHERGVVNDEVVLELDAGKTLTATITRNSGEDLGLAIGARAQALFKASHVILAVD